MTRQAVKKKTTVFIVPPGVKGVVVTDARDKGSAEARDFTTRVRSAFGVSEVVIDPQGRVGRWGPNSQTLAGEFARKGMIGFMRKSADGVCMVLIVPAELVSVEEV